MRGERKGERMRNKGKECSKGRELMKGVEEGKGREMMKGVEEGGRE